MWWSFIIFILIGAVAGWLAGIILKGKGFGFVINAIVGIVGGFLGGWLFGKLGISMLGSFGGFIAAVIGAIILLWIISLFKKK
ncbi:MAG: GlsB/YeaQ/YmgE family stress response membrane protein [Prolixibacteraceae bacterium]|nr:GlsB/YeaQ/YmgE family stress response membrane protein [Prolixibacteraceae bacterium]